MYIFQPHHSTLNSLGYISYCLPIILFTISLQQVYAAAMPACSIIEPGAQCAELRTSVTGQGTINDAVGGISCPTDCSENYSLGTVSLSATPASGWQFDGWSGDCVSATTLTNAIVPITAPTALTCNATFSLLPVTPGGTPGTVPNPDPDPIFRTLSVQVVGMGSLTGSTGDIDCPGDCDDMYPNRGLVSLFATPAEGWQFNGWGGDCADSPSAESADVVMTTDRQCSVNFTEIVIPDEPLPGPLTGVTTDNLGTLPLDVIRGLTITDLVSINPTVVSNATSRDVSRFITNLNPTNIRPVNVLNLLPTDWSIDLNTGELTAPPGTQLFFRALPALPGQPDNLIISFELQDLSSSFGLGGEGGTPLLESMNTLLDDSGVEGLDIMQSENGTATVTGLIPGTSATYNLMVDVNNLSQIDLSETPAGIDFLPGDQLVLTLPDGKRIPMLPIPQDLSELAMLIEGTVKMNEGGDVIIQQADGSILTLLFDPLALPGFDNLPTGLNVTNPGIRTTSPLGQVVFGNGSAQQIYPFIPRPEVFRETVLALDPVIESVVINVNDGTATVTLAGSDILLIPQNTVSLRMLLENDEILPGVIINPDLTVDYTVDDTLGSDRFELLSNIAISP